MNQHLHYSHQDKENSNEDSNSTHENELKKRLFDNLKKAGVLDGMKSSMRVRLYEQLKLQNEKANLNFKDQSNRLTFKIAVSMIVDLMDKCDMPYAKSVFLPECGLSSEILSKPELIEVLSLDKDDHYQAANKPEMTPLIMDLIEIIKTQRSVRPNCVNSFVQTEEAGEAAMTLDQRLKKVEYQQMEKQETERLMPFKTLEERMLKYKRELEVKYREDLDSEIRRLKEFEMSKMRMDEAQKYRQKLQEYRDELEQIQQQKLGELKIRESEMMERIKSRERDLDKLAFEVRQKQLMNEEVFRCRENELKKTFEVEQQILRTEKDKVMSTQRDYEIKVKELETMRVRLQKEHIEEIERYKSELSRQYSDQDFDIHRRKMQLEEDEQRVKFDKERLALIENKNAHMVKELSDTSEELKKATREAKELFKENTEMKDQLRVLNENLRRETELLLSRDKENVTLVQQNQMLKELLDETKQSSGQFKEDQGQLVENLRLQLNETREMIVKLRENKEKEFKKLKERYEDERRRESEQYQFEYEKVKQEITILQKRLGQEEHFSKELAIINNKLQTNVNGLRGTFEAVGSDYRPREVFTGKMNPSSFYPLSGGDDDNDENEEILKRKQAWAQLEREQEEVKRNIKSLMKTTPESRVIDDPLLAERVRGKSRYDNLEHEEVVQYEKKRSTETKQSSQKVKEEKKPAEKPQQRQEQKVASQSPVKKQEEKPAPSSSQSQKRQWTAEHATTVTTKTNQQNDLQKKKSEIEEEKKFSSYEPKTTTSQPSYQSSQPSTLSNVQPKPSTYEPQKSTQSSLPSVNNQTSATAQSSSNKKPGGFKGPSFNPFVKKTDTATSNAAATQQQPSSSLYGASSQQNTWNPPSNNTNTFSLTQPQITNNNNSKLNPLRRSTEKSEEIISDNIVDEYEEDFEIDETANKNTKPVSNFFLNQQNQQQTVNEESSGAYSEKAIEDDYF